MISIKPLYGLVAKLTQGTPLTLSLLYDGTRSPHTSDITPTEALALQHADLLIWAGGLYETHLVRMLHLPKASADLSQVPGLIWLPVRHPHTCTQNTHHHHVPHDGHYFLHPLNAIVLIDGIKHTLTHHFPTYTAHFQKQASIAKQDLFAFYHTQKKRIDDAHGNTVHYRVSHDFMVYFDAAFGTHSCGTLGKDPHHGPSVKEGLDILKHKDAIDLILYEDQFPSAFIDKLKQHAIVTQRIDYLGTDIPATPNAYEAILKHIVDIFVEAKSTLHVKRDKAQCDQGKNDN